MAQRLKDSNRAIYGKIQILTASRIEASSDGKLALRHERVQHLLGTAEKRAT